MPTPFAAQCDVSISNTYDTVGTLTKASLKRLTPTDVKALFTDGTKWHEMTSFLRTQFEMKACGVRRYGLYDWLMSSARPGMGSLIQSVKRDRGPSLIQPFIIGRQNSVVNTDYWVISCGCAKSGYTTHESSVACTSGTSMTGPLDVTGGAAGDRVIRVAAGYGLSLDAKWFNPGLTIFILNKSSGGSAKHGMWKVINAKVSYDGTSFIDVLVTTQNSFDTSTVDATPITGLVLVGINNVSDYEKYCLNSPNVNPVKYVPFWYQTTRRARRVDSEYRDTFAKLMEDNEWFSKFGDLPLAERNRQDELEYQKRMCNALFFSRPISNAQRLEGSPNWTSLDAISSLTGASVDPGTGSQTMEYRANIVGFYEQLRACGQVQDKQNVALDIRTFCETTIYDIVRARESRGRPSKSIDVYTDSTTADEFMTYFIQYAKEKVGDIIRVNIEEGSNEFGFSWKTFKLFKPQGVTVNIIVNEFFDDIQNLFATLPTGEQGSRGKFLAVLDLGKGGSIYPSILKSNRKVWKTGDLKDLARVDKDFACIMENPTIETTLVSETPCAIVECPKDSIWVENFNGISFTP